MKKIALIIFLLPPFTHILGQILVNPKPKVANEFVTLIEKAHNKTDFLKHKAIAFDIEVTWGGKLNLKATVTSQTNSGKIKMDYGNGVTVYFDGKDVFMTPSVNTYNRARFDVLTFQYFFFAPFKLRDKGVSVTPDIDRLSDGRAFPTAKMTFATGTGDSPDDWYILYCNAQTNKLDGMSYIVTYGNKKPDELTPNAITYNEWTTLDGVPFPTKWAFTEWSDAKGFTKIKGEAMIKNIRWIDKIEGVFNIPTDSKKVEK